MTNFPDLTGLYQAAETILMKRHITNFLEYCEILFTEYQFGKEIVPYLVTTYYTIGSDSGYEDLHNKMLPLEYLKQDDINSIYEEIVEPHEVGTLRPVHDYVENYYLRQEIREIATFMDQIYEERIVEEWYKWIMHVVVSDSVVGDLLYGYELECDEVSDCQNVFDNFDLIMLIHEGYMRVCDDALLPALKNRVKYLVEETFDHLSKHDQRIIELAGINHIGYQCRDWAIEDMYQRIYAHDNGLRERYLKEQERTLREHRLEKGARVVCKKEEMAKAITFLSENYSAKVNVRMFIEDGDVRLEYGCRRYTVPVEEGEGLAEFTLSMNQLKAFLWYEEDEIEIEIRDVLMIINQSTQVRLQKQTYHPH